MLTNCFIHVIMYGYYFLCSVGRPPRWKKVVTQSQILQFVFSFAMGLAFLAVRLHRKRGQACSGEPSLAMNVGINAVFLTLFVDFHRKNYKQRSAAKKKLR